MSILNLELKYITSAENSIKSTVNELKVRKSDYDGIRNNVSNISSSSENLSECNSYLMKKNNMLQDKIDKLNSFKTKLTTFSSNAKAADTRVSTYITDESNTFYKTVGIKTGWKAGWQNFKKEVSTAWKTVKNFYEEHKYVIDFIADLALLAVAVVSLIAAIPTGGATLFFAGFALVQSIGDMTTSTVALGYHIAGNDNEAGIWAERGLKDGVKWVGKKVGGEMGETILGFIYDGVMLSSVIYSSTKLVKGLVKAVDLRNTNNISVFGRFKTAGTNIFGIKVTDKTGKTLAQCWEIKQLFGLKTVDSARRVIIGSNFISNIKTAIKTIDSIYTGNFLKDGNKIGSSISKVHSNIIDFYTGFRSTAEYVG